MFGCPVEILQHEEELSWFIDKVKEAKPVHVMEIGSLLGGTLWCWMQACPVASEFVSIDLIIPGNDPRYEQQMNGHKKLWHEWAKERDHKLIVIDADSTKPVTFERAKAAMPVVDFLFIDGAHDYESVKADYRMYSELVRGGGMIGFHDIETRVSSLFGVRKFWDEFKTNHKTEEKVMSIDRGIGIYVKPWNVT